jgi:hypothetical protein
MGSSGTVAYRGGDDMHWLSHFLGLDNLSGPYYGFWSGAGSDITELALVGVLVEFMRRHTCHMHRCLRPANHPVTVDGVTYRVCRKHHPDSVDKLRPYHIGGDT